MSSQRKGRAEQIFETLPSPDGSDIKPSQYVSWYWNEYKKNPYKKNNALNGSMFEVIIKKLLEREKLLPMYFQAKLAFIPNVVYDIVFYTENNVPISISLKTSLRERKKQADLEAIVLKNVYRKSECYLVSLEKDEVKKAKKELQDGDLLGLDDVILADCQEFDDFIDNLKEKTFLQVGKIDVIKSNRIITPDI